MDLNTLINLTMIYAAGFMIGWGIILILLWIRPEYGFLVFYVVSNHVVVFLLSHVWQLTWTDAPSYALYSVVNLAIAIAAGAPIVALFKWLKARKSGDDKKLDREMQVIRAEIAAREGQPQS